MREKKTGSMEVLLGEGGRWVIGCLGILTLQVLSILLCWGCVWMYWKGLEWTLYAAGVLLPFLWGVGGYLLRPFLQGREKFFLFLALWTVLPACLCWWAEQGASDLLLVILCPQLLGRAAWFHPLFDGPQSAYALDTLRPLAAAGTHVLMMAGFALGRHEPRRRKKQKSGGRV